MGDGAGVVSFSSVVGTGATSVVGAAAASAVVVSVVSPFVVAGGTDDFSFLGSRPEKKLCRLLFSVGVLASAGAADVSSVAAGVSSVTAGVVVSAAVVVSSAGVSSVVVGTAVGSGDDSLDCLPLKRPVGKLRDLRLSFFSGAASVISRIFEIRSTSGCCLSWSSFSHCNFRDNNSCLGSSCCRLRRFRGRSLLCGSRLLLNIGVL